jgi:hypothetical protein
MHGVALGFPVRHFREAMLASFAPRSATSGVPWGHLAVVALWGVAGLVVAVRTFRWAPVER